MDKNAIKKYAVWARTELIARVSQKALQYGIEKDKIIIVNGKYRKIEINISDIESILIPSSTALKSKVNDYPIIIKRKDSK